MRSYRTDHASRPARSRPALCVGLDLAGVEHRETGVAILRDGRLERLTTAATDVEVVALARRSGRRGTVAINAPLTRPRGRCCLDDDCPCRHDPGTRSRQLERDLARMGIPTLATGLLKVLARRGRRIALALRLAGLDPIEVYPYASLRVLGLPAAGKKTAAGRRRIHRALKPLVPGLDHPAATEHQLDAVVCALTAHLWRQGRTRVVGAPEEGVMILPDTPVRAASARPAARPTRSPRIGASAVRAPAGGAPAAPGVVGRRKKSVV